MLLLFGVSSRVFAAHGIAPAACKARRRENMVGVNMVLT